LCGPTHLACLNYSGETEHCSGIGLKLSGSIAEPVFTFIPESGLRSSRNAFGVIVIAFALARILYYRGDSGRHQNPRLARVSYTPRGPNSKGTVLVRDGLILLRLRFPRRWTLFGLDAFRPIKEYNRRQSIPSPTACCNPFHSCVSCFVLERKSFAR